MDDLCTADLSPHGNLAASCSRPLKRGNADRAKTIITAARKCFLEKGYGATSMDQVAATAKVSKATVYAYFGSKQELFGAFLNNQCDAHAQGLGGIALDDIKSGQQAIELLVRHLMDRILDPATLSIWRIVSEEGYRHPELAHIFYTQGLKRGRGLIGEKLEHLARRGLLVIDNGFEAADLAIGMLRGDIFNRALFGLPDDQINDRERVIAKTIKALETLWTQKPAPKSEDKA